MALWGEINRHHRVAYVGTEVTIMEVSWAQMYVAHNTCNLLSHHYSKNAMVSTPNMRMKFFGMLSVKSKIIPL